MLAIWSLVPLPFLNPAWTSGSSWFTYCWSLAWRILSMTLLACAAAAKSLQLCLTLCNPRDSSPPGSLVPGILQARTLEWVAISFSSAWKWKVKVKSLSCVRLLDTPWAAAYQVPLPMGFLLARVLEWVAIAFSMLACEMSAIVHWFEHSLILPFGIGMKTDLFQSSGHDWASQIC